MSEREPTGRHRLATNLEELVVPGAEDSPLPGPLPHRAPGVRISIGDKALGAIVAALIAALTSGGTGYLMRSGAPSADQHHSLAARVDLLERAQQHAADTAQADRDASAAKFQRIDEKLADIRQALGELADDMKTLTRRTR